MLPNPIPIPVKALLLMSSKFGIVKAYCLLFGSGSVEEFILLSPDVFCEGVVVTDGIHEKAFG